MNRKMFTIVLEKWYEKKTEHKITRIVNALRKRVFEGLDRKKEEVAHTQPDYNDFGWICEILPSWQWYTYVYYKGNDIVCLYDPFKNGGVGTVGVLLEYLLLRGDCQ